MMRHSVGLPRHDVDARRLVAVAPAIDGRARYATAISTKASSAQRATSSRPSSRASSTSRISARAPRQLRRDATGVVLIDAKLEQWIRKQALFFVASAPSGTGGHVNVSPKGPIGSLRVTGEKTIAYLDVVGSGAETIAHVRDNGRVVIMLCAFEGPPRIVRIHGRGEVVFPSEPRFDEMLARHAFVDPGTPQTRRALIVVHVERVADSCGYGVPLMKLEGTRPQLPAWGKKKLKKDGPNAIVDYQTRKNTTSIDGLPAIESGPASMSEWKRAPARTELLALYKETDALMAPFSCPASTDCCRFAVTGREPYPHAVEMAEVLDAARAVAAPKKTKLAVIESDRERRCTFLSDRGRCVVYASRPFGCRTYFCEKIEGGKLPRDAIQSIARRIADLSARAFPRDPGPRALTRALERASTNARFDAGLKWSQRSSGR